VFLHDVVEQFPFLPHLGLATVRTPFSHSKDTIFLGCVAGALESRREVNKPAGTSVLPAMHVRTPHRWHGDVRTLRLSLRTLLNRPFVLLTSGFPLGVLLELLLQTFGFDQNVIGVLEFVLSVAKQAAEARAQSSSARW
jgi:hypothetical protein